MITFGINPKVFQLLKYFQKDLAQISLGFGLHLARIWIAFRSDLDWISKVFSKWISVKTRSKSLENRDLVIALIGQKVQVLKIGE